jgi:hypothetical protein
MPPISQYIPIILKIILSMVCTFFAFLLFFISIWLCIWSCDKSCEVKVTFFTQNQLKNMIFCNIMWSISSAFYFISFCFFQYCNAIWVHHGNLWFSCIGLAVDPKPIYVIYVQEYIYNIDNSIEHCMHIISHFL